MTRSVGTAIVLGLSLCGVIVPANSGTDAGPLAGFDDIEVAVFIGDSSEVARNRGTPLFSGDDNAEEEARSKIEKAMTERLRQGGLRVSSRSTNVMRVALSGGKFEGEGCAGTNFFMIRIEVCDSDGFCPADTTVLGAAADSELTNRLVTTTANLAAEFSEQRSAWRKSHKL